MVTLLYTYAENVVRIYKLIDSETLCFKKKGLQSVESVFIEIKLPDEE